MNSFRTLVAFIVVSGGVIGCPRSTPPSPASSAVPAVALKDIDGLYESKEDDSQGLEWILLRTDAGKTTGIYAGQVRIEGSVLHYQTPMLDLFIKDDGTIGFTIGAYDIYEQPLKPLDVLPKENAGSSNDPEKYRGKITDGRIELTCNPAALHDAERRGPEGECVTEPISFKRVASATTK